MGGWVRLSSSGCANNAVWFTDCLLSNVNVNVFLLDQNDFKMYYGELTNHTYNLKCAAAIPTSAAGHYLNISVAYIRK